MAIISPRGKTLIIDRSLPEIMHLNNRVEGRGLQAFYLLLRKLGVDQIELNSNVFKRLPALPELGQVIFRVEKERDLALTETYQFGFVVMPEDFFFQVYLPGKINIRSKILLELNLDNLEELPGNKKLAVISELAVNGIIHRLRLQGLNKTILPFSKEVLPKITKLAGVKVDICPDNRLYLATALALNAVENGAASITAVFNGKGGAFNFGALEEILVASSVVLNSRLTSFIYNNMIAGDLAILAELSCLYQQLTNMKVPRKKAIIGKDIFAYESGIHADGIAKCSLTYEPFAPETVGLRRKLVIGKHSGEKAIICKLLELELPLEREKIPGLLKRVRQRSMMLKRGLNDEEFVRLHLELQKTAMTIPG